jgi:NAD+ diphosphatase
VRAGRLPHFPFRLSGHERLVDRRSDAAFLDAAWKDPDSRVVIARGNELAVNEAQDRLRTVSPADAPSGPHLLLGAAAGATWFLVVVEPETPIDLGPMATLRRLIDRLNETELSLAVHAASIGGWHQRHPMCAVCGSATDIADAGASRLCPTCGTQHFPRTDPAVIMLVIDADDRCLLGHNSARADGWFSTLAGFVEPGESPEEAVAREVMEESGIQVADVTYAGSQPWPFPSSLMLGFFATAASTDIQVDGEEITEARWFTRDEITREVEAGTIVVPTQISIAGALLAHWYGGPLPSNQAV